MAKKKTQIKRGVADNATATPTTTAPAKAAPAKAAETPTSGKKKVGGTIKWQEHLSPLRKFSNVVLAMYDLPPAYHPSKQEIGVMQNRIRGIVADLKTNEVTIPRRLKGKLEEVLAK